jgi:alkanesulfonate monooxygenase SsuD/methylene tetrahydromethanopterin reductase-like flavin-dependent oxidoreductase (luciferase family)
VTDFGIMLPTLGVAGGGYRVTDAARQAEELGYDSVWAVDHLAFHTGIIDPVGALSAAAAVTDRVALGFGVLLAAMRQPALMAKQIASLQVLSGRRVRLGVGVGGENPAEWAGAGVPLRGRGRRTDAILAGLPALLAGRPVRLDAPFDIDVPALSPAVAMPPLWIGGRSDAALDRAARFGDGWLGLFVTAEQLPARRATLAAFARRYGRRPPRIGVTLFVHVDDTRPARARGEATDYLRSLYRLTERTAAPYVVAGTTAQVAEQVAAMVAEGVDQVVLLPAATDYFTQCRRLAALLNREEDCDGNGCSRHGFVRSQPRGDQCGDQRLDRCH